MLNMRPQHAAGAKQIGRMGTRPGSRLSFLVLFSGAVQSMVSVGKSSGVGGFSTGTPDPVVAPVSWKANKLKGQCVLLDTDWSVTAVFDDTRGFPVPNVPPTWYGGFGAYNCCFHNTDPDIGFFFPILRDTNHTTQDVQITGINRVNLATRSITHQQYAVDADAPYTPPLGGSPTQYGRYINEAVAWGPYLFCAIGNRIYTFRSDNLTYIKRQTSDWGMEYQSLRVVRIAEVDYLLAAFQGSSTVSGPVVADASVPAEKFGHFYRSAIELWRINYDNAGAVAVAADAITRVAMPMGLPDTDPGYENHFAFRFSEFSVQRPRGAIPYSFDVDPATGNVYIGRTNQGFGYNGSAGQRPDGTAPYVSLAKGILEAAYLPNPPAYINPAAVPAGTYYGFGVAQGGWEIDTGSFRRLFAWNGNNFYNDIPKLAGSPPVRNPQFAADAPSCYAVVYDPVYDRVYTGGVSSANRSNIYCVRGSTGDILWERDIGALVNQNAIAVDPTTGNVVVGFLRKDFGVPFGKAELIELDRLTGATVRVFDLTDDINNNGKITGIAADALAVSDVAINSRGQLLLALSPYRYDT